MSTLIIPADFYGFPYRFPVRPGTAVQPPSTPTNLVITGTVVSPPAVSLSATGSPLVDHYDIYRSTSALQLGSRINQSPIAQPGSPYSLTYVDNAANSISAPAVGVNYYYRMVAVNSENDTSLPTDAVQVAIESGNFVQDPVLITLVGALRADNTLVAMLGGDVQNIRFHKRIKEQGDTYPFVVLWRSDWKENPKFKDQRFGTLTYQISVVHNQATSEIVVNVINRIAALLDGQPGKDIFKGSPSIMVLMSMFIGGGPEAFNDQLKLWFQNVTLKLECQLFAT